jgi:3',5'-cyclic AMP phosphodiesterase CpdA
MHVRTSWLTIACCGVLVAAAATAQPPQQQPIPSTPPWQSATSWPDRIVVTLEQDPQTSFSVTWRTHSAVGGARAEIVRADDHARIDLGAAPVEASTETPDIQHKLIDGEEYALRWNEHIDPPAYHSVTFTGLEADTLYAYRVMGAEGHWSEWFQTRTAPVDGTPFKFLYFGDAQDGILSHWARVVRAAYAAAPDARFAIHAGDLVNIGSRDFEWAEWFRSVGFIHGTIPALPAVGNHEYFDGLSRPEGGMVTGLSVLWRPQFTLPQDPALPDALRETVYSVRYGDAVIAVLDTMAEDYFDVQAEWLDGVLGASDARWKVVAMHHPMFEMLERPYGEPGPERRAAFLPVFERHGVDIVLQGHDHSYGRGATYSGRRAPSAARGDLGTVFVTSSAGAKMYGVSDEGWAAFTEHGAVLERMAENTPFFQVISLDGNALTYEARTATGRLYDAFRLEKARRGPNRLVDLPTDIDDARRFDNTGPYESSRLDVVPPLPARE